MHVSWFSPSIVYPDTAERKQQLVEHLLYKAKEIEALISVLPSASDLKSSSTKDVVKQSDGNTSEIEGSLQVEDEDKELQELESEMQAVNAEYIEVLATAGTLHTNVL